MEADDSAKDIWNPLVVSVRSIVTCDQAPVHLPLASVVVSSEYGVVGTCMYVP